MLREAPSQRGIFIFQCAPFSLLSVIFRFDGIFIFSLFGVVVFSFSSSDLYMTLSLGSMRPSFFFSSFPDNDSFSC